MNAESTVYIFHLTDIEGQPLFLHPFERNPRLVEKLENMEIMGFYGKEPRVESLTMLRNDLYRNIDKGLKLWLSEERFIPKFLISSAVFMLLYIFFAFLVRDPLPFADEFVLSLAGSLGTFFFLGKRDKESQSAIKKRIALRNKVDHIHFSESSVIKNIENLIQEWKENPQKSPGDFREELKFLLEWDHDHRVAFINAVELELLYILKLNKKKLMKILNQNEYIPEDTYQTSLLFTYQLLKSQ